MANAPSRPGRPTNAEKAARDAVRDAAPDAATATTPPLVVDITVREENDILSPSQEEKIPAREERRPFREEDPRARAARRAAELRDNRDDSFDGSDQFYIDRSVIPSGWDYEWKSEFVAGQEQHQRMLAHHKAGWEEVMTGRHPDMMPIGADPNKPIRRDGMILMERPLEITEESRRRELHRARSQVSDKEQQATSSDMGGDRVNRAKIKHSYEAMHVPD